MTLQDFLSLGEGYDCIRIPVCGHCLEDAGICDGDTVAVDLQHMPKPPNKAEGYRDYCWCYGTPNRDAAPGLMVKEYLGRWGYMHLVGTRYRWGSEHWRMDYAFEPVAIRGVICAVYDAAGRIKWGRDTSQHPAALPVMGTISGDNVGDPMPPEDVECAGKELEVLV